MLLSGNNFYYMSDFSEDDSILVNFSHSNDDRTKGGVKYLFQLMMQK